MTPLQIAAARQYAPPLIVVGRVDRRGARLRRVSRRAVEYARRAGMPLEVVYPGGVIAVRRLAPMAGTPEALRFLRATGLPMGEVYPPVAFGGELRGKRRWPWIAVGAAIGAMVGGPVGMVVGCAVGSLR